MDKQKQDGEAGRAELLAALDATTPEEFDDVKRGKGDLVRVHVPQSKKKKPPVFVASAYTKPWMPTKAEKKKKRKRSKKSRRRNRRK